MQNNEMNSLLNQIYDAYQDAIKDASFMWKSAYCYSQEGEDKRNKEDKEDLNYFKELLQKIDKNFVPQEES